MQTRQAGGTGGEEGGREETSRLGFKSQHPGVSGGQRVEKCPGQCGLAPVWLLSRSRSLGPARDEAAATFLREPAALSARWQETLQGSSPPAFTARLGGLMENPPSKAVKAGGSG